MMRHLTYAVLALCLVVFIGCGGSNHNLLSIAVKEGTQFPTLVVTGSTVTAYFTVSNNVPAHTYHTISIASLPPNVTQVTTDGTYADTCGNPATLTGAGLAGSSCTLQLTISGAVTTNQGITGCLNQNISCQRAYPPSNILELSSIEIAPATFDADIGDTQQFTATGTYSDNTTGDITSLITWTSSNTDAVTLSDTGLATAVAGGSGTIMASYDILDSNEATFTVAEAISDDARFLSDIMITPANPSVDLNTQTQQFTATGTYDDLSTDDISSSVTWTSSMTDVATISSSGLATILSSGTTDISATLDGIISNVATLTVTP